MARSFADKVSDQLWGNMRRASEQHSRLPEDTDYQEFHDSETSEEVNRRNLPLGVHITTAEADSRLN